MSIIALYITMCQIEIAMALCIPERGIKYTCTHFVFSSENVSCTDANRLLVRLAERVLRWLACLKRSTWMHVRSSHLIKRGTVTTLQRSVVSSNPIKCFRCLP